MRSSEVTDEIKSAKDTCNSLSSTSILRKDAQRMLLYDYRLPRDFINQSAGHSGGHSGGVLRAPGRAVSREWPLYVGNPRIRKRSQLWASVTSIDLTIAEPKPEAQNRYPSLSRKFATVRSSRSARTNWRRHTLPNRGLQIVQMGSSMKVQQSNLWFTQFLARESIAVRKSWFLRARAVDSRPGPAASTRAQLKQVRENC